MNQALPVSLLLFVPVQHPKPTARRGNGLFRPRLLSSRTGERPAGAQEKKSTSGSSLLPDAEEGGRIRRRETLRFSPAQRVLLSRDAGVAVKAAPRPAVPVPRARADPHCCFPELRSVLGESQPANDKVF